MYKVKEPLSSALVNLQKHLLVHNTYSIFFCFLNLKYTSSNLLIENLNCFSLPLPPCSADFAKYYPAYNLILILSGHLGFLWGSAEPVPWVLLLQSLTQYVSGWAMWFTFSTSWWSLEWSFPGKCNINHKPKTYWPFIISETPMFTYPSPMMFQCSSHCKSSRCLSQNCVGRYCSHEELASGYLDRALESAFLAILLVMCRLLAHIQRE